MAAAMSSDLVLKTSCEGCGKTSELYGSNCKHTTLCVSCGKKRAESRARCNICGATLTNLIREYNVRASAATDKAFYIGRFVTGLPPFSKRKNPENKWSLHKEGLQGRQLTDGLREKFKNKPWVLEDDTGKHQYQGQVEGAQSAAYYLLMMHGKEFVAIPAGSWYNFNKVAQYKQLTLEEAEEKIAKRKTNASGYERWMMKAATNGPAAFGGQAAVKVEGGGSGDADGNHLKKGKNNADGDNSDRGEEDEEVEDARKNRLGLNKKGVDEDEDGGGGDDFDLDDDIEKGDDWEHEETFTDDDEAVGNDPEEREHLDPEVPAPPEIKMDDDDEEEGNDEEGGLSKSGKELKKLLGKAAGQNESDADEDDDDDDMDDENITSPVLAPKQKDAPKDEHVDSTLAKTAPSGSARATPSASKSSKSKRKAGSDDAKNANGPPVKKESKSSSVKDEPSSSSRASVPPNASISTSVRTGQSSSVSPVTADEIRTALLQGARMTAQDLVAIFKARLRTSEDKAAFADILKEISKIQKTNGLNYIVLRGK